MFRLRTYLLSYLCYDYHFMDIELYWVFLGVGLIIYFSFSLNIVVVGYVIVEDM